MKNLISLDEFSAINESSMDYTYGEDPNKSLLLFSDTIRKDFDESGGKFYFLYDFYDPDIQGDPDKFVGLKLLDDSEINSVIRNYRNGRFTWFNRSVWKDTEAESRKNLSIDQLRNILDTRDNYYFYNLVRGDRNSIQAPIREDVDEVISTDDGRNWTFIITKNTPCQLVKMKSRGEGGKWAEYKLSSLYDWEHKSSSIRLKIKKNGEILKVIRSDENSGKLYNILHSNDEDIFEIVDDPNTFVKYDLIVDDDKKLEVKKIRNESEIWDETTKPYQLAEQCKIANRTQIEKAVAWYRNLYSHLPDSEEFIESDLLFRTYVGDREISNVFKSSYGGEFSEICEKIRDFFNSKIDRLLESLNNIPKRKWMAGVYGIYFTGLNRTDRRMDFLIKIDEGVRYEWDSIPSEWGFNRLKLFTFVNGNAWEYLLTEDNNFVKAFQLKNWRNYIQQKKNGEITAYDGSVYIYDESISRWKLKKRKYTKKEPEKTIYAKVWQSKIRNKIKRFNKKII